MNPPTPTFYPAPRPIGLGEAPQRTYPQGAIRHPVLQALAKRGPIGVGGVADAVGTTVGILEIVGTVAVIIIGVDVIRKWAGHGR